MYDLLWEREWEEESEKQRRIHEREILKRYVREAKELLQEILPSKEYV